MAQHNSTFFGRLTFCSFVGFVAVALASACASSALSSAAQVPADFVANRDIQIAAFDGDRPVAVTEPGRSYRLVTRGLARLNRREIEVVDVPVALVESTATLMNAVANFTVNVEPIGNGESWAQAYGPIVVAARCFELSSHGEGVLRLVDIENRVLVAAPPLTAITSYSYLNALALLDEGKDNLAKETLLSSVALFPGSPDADHYHLPNNAIANQQNWLTYLALTRLADRDQDRYLGLALERSPELLQYELGTEKLPVVAADDLKHDVAFLIDSAQKSPGGEPWGQRAKDAEAARGAAIMSLLVSPVLEPGTDGKMARSIRPTPVPFRAFFYEEPVATLLRSKETVEIIADLYMKHQSRPIDLILLTRKTSWQYLGETEPAEAFGMTAESSAPRQIQGVAYRPHLKALSALAADVGRRLGAGLSPAEIRATTGLTSDASLRATGEAKLAALEVREAAWFTAALGL